MDEALEVFKRAF